MPLISGSIPNLTDGISQQPATLRMPSQGELQENAVSHLTRGLEKRPATEHVALLEGITSTSDNDVFIHTIRRTEDEAYALTIKGGTATVDPEVRLIDLTGFATGTPGSEVYIHPTEQTGNILGNGALDPDVAGYLSNFSDSNPFDTNKLGATTIADYSFILNKTQKVKQLAGSYHKARNYESLLYIKTGDFDSTYKATVTEYNVTADGLIDRDSPVVQWEVAFKTPSNDTASLSLNNTSTSTDSKTINNYAAIKVANICHTLWKGVVPTTEVVLEEHSSTIHTHTAETAGTANPVEYTGDEAVIDSGTVTTRYRTYSGGTWGSWVDSTGGLEQITTTYTRFSGAFTTGESIISLENNDKPFLIEITDGKGDTYGVAINGHDETSAFGKLPGTGVPFEFVAKVSGDSASNEDDYYVEWNGSVWKETTLPLYPNPTASAILEKQALDTIDYKTMPIQLYKAFGTVNGEADSIYFVLQTVDWDSRTVGNYDNNPFPSFCNYDPDDHPDGLFTIQDIFFHRNRLGFISDENVILSETSEYFNFFSKTVLTILDSAPIDVAVSNSKVALLNSAIPFQDNLVLFSDLQQFKLVADTFLTPTSVTIDVATNFEVSSDTSPVAAGKTIFFPFKRGAYSGIREYFIDVASETSDAEEVTKHVPDYIEGTVVKLASSPNEETLCVLTDADRKVVYVYKYFYSEGKKLQSSWSKWIFDAEILDIEFIGSIAFILFKRGTAVYLEKMNMSVDTATLVMSDRVGVRLDRRVRLKYGEVETVPYTDVNHDAVTNSTVTTVTDNQYGSRILIDNVIEKPRIGQKLTFATHPLTKYSVVYATDVTSGQCYIDVTPSIGIEQALPSGTDVTFEERSLVYLVETGEIINENQLAAVLEFGTNFSNSKGISQPNVFVGIPYTFKYQFSEQFVKSNEVSINQGRLQMRKYELSYDKTGYFEVEISPKPYDDRLRKINTRVFTGQIIGSSTIGVKKLSTGVFKIPILANSKDVRVTVKSDLWYPVALQSVDWEGYFVTRNQRV